MRTPRSTIPPVRTQPASAVAPKQRIQLQYRLFSCPVILVRSTANQFHKSLRWSANMAQIVADAVSAAASHLAKLRQLDREAGIKSHALVPGDRLAAEPVVVVNVAPSTASAAVAVPQPQVAASQTSQQEEEDIPLTETVRAELRRLENTVREVTEVNDRVMAQNIALLADLEAAQRAVRELRAEKDTLAVQLRRALERA